MEVGVGPTRWCIPCYFPLIFLFLSFWWLYIKIKLNHLSLKSWLKLFICVKWVVILSANPTNHKTESRLSSKQNVSWTPKFSLTPLIFFTGRISCSLFCDFHSSLSVFLLHHVISNMYTVWCIFNNILYHALSSLCLWAP